MNRGSMFCIGPLIQPDLIIMTRILWPKGGHINSDVAKEKISRLFYQSPSRMFYSTASSKLPLVFVF